jgi:hypothetical protein
LLDTHLPFAHPDTAMPADPIVDLNVTGGLDKD